ncbi:MAG: hypothetical protein H0X62_03395 [Bacteroidetes bacterium]|nr:hypothetical protein [Bacteroidota bacterium]
MKKMKILAAVMIVALTVSTTSCNKERLFEEKETTAVANRSEINPKELDPQDIADCDRVSKALSLAMGDLNIRKLIKDEALLEFDGDYDVLYSSIANNILPDGKIFKKF